MYVRTGKLGGARRLGRANRVSRLGRLRGVQRIVVSGLGQDDSGSVTDNPQFWQTLQTGIVTAGQDAAVALQNPTYSSVTNPVTGVTTVTAYGQTGQSIANQNLGMGSLSTLFSSPLVLILGIGALGLIAFSAMKQR